MDMPGTTYATPIVDTNVFKIAGSVPIPEPQLICPILSVGRVQGDRECLGDRCAWWTKYFRKCGMMRQW